MKTSARGVSGKGTARRGRDQSAAGARRRRHFVTLFDTRADAEPDLDSDVSDPVLSDPVLGVGVAAWTDPETGLPPQAAILHVEED